MGLASGAGGGWRVAGGERGTAGPGWGGGGYGGQGGELTQRVPLGDRSTVVPRGLGLGAGRGHGVLAAGRGAGRGTAGPEPGVGGVRGGTRGREARRTASHLASIMGCWRPGAFSSHVGSSGSIALVEHSAAPLALSTVMKCGDGLWSLTCSGRRGSGAGPAQAVGRRLSDGRRWPLDGEFEGSGIVAGLRRLVAHEEDGLAQAAPWVVQLREEDVGGGEALVLRGGRSPRDEVGRRSHQTKSPASCARPGFSPVCVVKDGPRRSASFQGGNTGPKGPRSAQARANFAHFRR